MIVFGFEVSILQLILGYAVLSGACLIFLAVELYKLSSLLLLEKGALSSFSSGLKEFEAEEKKIALEEKRISKDEREIAEEEGKLKGIISRAGKRIRRKK
ncbi:MAG: hypothetical protein ABH829_05375 [archaeon]